MDESTPISELTVGQLCRLIAAHSLMMHGALDYPNSHDRLEAAAKTVERLALGETLADIRSPKLVAKGKGK